MIQFTLMTEEEKKIVSDWKYDGKYSVYNIPPYEEQKEKGIIFADTDDAKKFFSYYENDKLIGYVKITQKTESVIMGIGIRPDLCSKGFGQRMLTVAVQSAIHTYAMKPICLNVRTWNERAINCYKKCGFVIEEEFEQDTASGKENFFKMTYKIALKI